MWELPSVEGRLDDAKVIEAVRGFGLAPLRIAPLGDAKHIFTHVEWHMTGWRVTVEEPLEKEGLEWIDPRRLQLFGLILRCGNNCKFDEGHS